MVMLFLCGLPSYSIRHLRFKNEVKLNVYQLNINDVPPINYCANNIVSTLQ